jgi:hypothetical protein
MKLINYEAISTKCYECVSSLTSVIWYAKHIFLVQHYFTWPVWLYYICFFVQFLFALSLSLSLSLSHKWQDFQKNVNGHKMRVVIFSINLLKPTGYVMHQQFNIQQLYALPTLYLCVLYGSQNKQRPLLCTSLTDCFL